MIQITYSGSSRTQYVYHVTYLPILPQRKSRYELSYRGDLQQPVEFKTVCTENNYVPNRPVLLLSCFCSKSQQLSATFPNRTNRWYLKKCRLEPWTYAFTPHIHTSRLIQSRNRYFSGNSDIETSNCLTQLFPLPCHFSITGPCFFVRRMLKAPTLQTPIHQQLWY